MLSRASKLDTSGPGRLKKIAPLCAATLLLVGCGGHRTPGSGNCSPSKPGPSQQVHLIWTKTDGWRVNVGNGDQKPADAHSPVGHLIGPTQFTVDIQGPTTASFKDPGGMDVWEGPNAKSAPQSGINSTQILGPIVTKNGKQLIFYDLNQGPGTTLNYQLNFDSGPSVDPIIDNGGNS